MDGLGLFYSLFGIGVIVAGILASWLFYEYFKSGSKDPLALHPAPKYNHPSPAPPVSPSAVYQFQWPFSDMSLTISFSISFSSQLRSPLSRTHWKTISTGVFGV